LETKQAAELNSLGMKFALLLGYTPTAVELEKIDVTVEALIFAAEKPITQDEIKSCLEEVMDSMLSDDTVQQSIERVRKKFESEEYGFGVYPVAGGIQFMTKPSFYNAVGILLKQGSKKRLSRSALETLSIIAYKQPIPKGDIEKIRGVNCDYALQKLLDKELVHIMGRSQALGRPLLYGTSQKFMEYFGLNDLSELPALKDFKLIENQIGEDEDRPVQK